MVWESPDLWYAALASRHGVVISVDDPVATKQKLYAIRKKLHDPDLDDISIMTSPDPGELWLVKRKRYLSGTA
jgi:hypothetical protein